MWVQDFLILLTIIAAIEPCDHLDEPGVKHALSSLHAFDREGKLKACITEIELLCFVHGTRLVNLGEVGVMVTYQLIKLDRCIEYHH